MSMDEDELDTIRRKKLAELQQYQTQAVAEQQYRDQVQAQRQRIRSSRRTSRISSSSSRRAGA